MSFENLWIIIRDKDAQFTPTLNVNDIGAWNEPINN